IADDDPAACRDRKGGRELGQRDAQIADEFPGLEDVPEIAQHRGRIGEKQRTHAPAGRGEIPQRNERDQERDLNRAAGETSLAFVAGSSHGVGPTELSAMVLRISSCSRGESSLRMAVNLAEVTKSGLRGCGSSILMISLMVPGRAENTATRSARNVASPRLWVTNTMVLSARASSTERSSPRIMRVCSSSAP